MTQHNLYVSLICLSLLNACTHTHATNNIDAIKQNKINNHVLQEKIRQDNVIELVKFSNSYAARSLDEQKQAYLDINETPTADNDDISRRIKLAMMLSLPSSHVRDINKAQILLQNLLLENGLITAEYALINLLFEYTLDSTKLMQKNRDDSKKLEAAQAKYDALEQKLNDLKNIEKTMNDRDIKSINKP